MILNQILVSCKEQWDLALTQKKHPYRFFALGTAHNSKPGVRTVVLRDFNSNSMKFTIFTDARSSKVLSVKNNPEIALLFYDPETHIQIRVDARCVLIKNDDKLFNKQTPTSQHDYTTTLAPGTPIETISSVSFLKENNHFMKLVFEASKIDFLELNRVNHTRAVFEKVNSIWQGEFRTP